MHLVQGVDVWLNTPRRPWEACGTSGMKVLVNGGLNCSVLDGWWAEAYEPALGWAIGDGRVHSETAEGVREQDALDAERLYTVLEREIIPEFYDRDGDDVPQAWTARVRESMARLTPRFSANRSVREYTELHYIPAAEACRARAAKGGELARQLTDWEHEVDAKWARVRVGGVAVNTQDGEHTFTAQVDLGGLGMEAVLVQLFADAATPGETPTCVAMGLAAAASNAPGMTAFSAHVPAARPAGDYTVRVTPYHAAAIMPLEDGRVLWQR